MRRRPRMQFSLAACLIATTLVAIVVGRAATLANRQAMLVARVDKHGGQLSYEPRRSYLAVLARPLRGLVSNDLFFQVMGINLRHKSASLPLLDAIGGCTQLRTLDLRACQVTDEGVARLGRLRRLESLDLSLNRISDQSLAVIGTFAGLYHLELSGNKLSDKAVLPLAELPRLFSLRLDQTKIGDGAMQWVGRISTLETLDIAETNVTDRGLELLSSLPRLKNLRIGRAGLVTDQGLESLCRLPSLSHLSLVEQLLTDDSLRVLTRFPRLKYLSLEAGEGDFSATAIEHFKQQRPNLTIHGDARLR